jgi:Ca-activated chloride channel homolog
MRLFVCVFIALQVTFSARTEMVVLPVAVTDAHGHSVAALTPDAFHVYDEGRLQQIALFRGGEIPITLGLIVDHSQSMGTKLVAVERAAAAFARAGRPDDELFGVSFSDTARLLPLDGGTPFTSDPATLESALLEATDGGATALYDAVAEGLLHLGLGHADRRALIVVTDGGDNASHLKYGQVRELARQSGAAIYGIGLIGSASQDEDPEVLKRLCRDSGGVAYFPAKGADLSVVFAQIATDLREQYTIGFVPSASDARHAFHSIKVTATGPGGAKLNVRTREGYSTRPIQ